MRKQWAEQAAEQYGRKKIEDNPQKKRKLTLRAQFQVRPKTPPRKLKETPKGTKSVVNEETPEKKSEDTGESQPKRQQNELQQLSHLNATLSKSLQESKYIAKMCQSVAEMFRYEADLWQKAKELVDEELNTFIEADSN